ncbi:MAG TPA: FAD:protein FMN transferase [Dehalococcoidia bacterium]|nr:FAD:protein FMN transferase [Dehalococcoidia bacterium]
MTSLEQATADAPPAPQSEHVLWAPLSRRFRAMNTDVLIVGRADSAVALRAIEALFHTCEAQFSRFRRDSELARFNARTTARVDVSVQMLEMIRLAQAFHRRTGGLFDPAVLPHLEAAGYDRSFERVAWNGDAPVAPRATWGSVADVALDETRRACVAPIGLRLDFGGIGKGFAIDRAARRLAPTRDYLIDAGGDVFASGDGPQGGGWRIGVWDPHGGPDIDVVTLRDQAIGTSSTVSRRWERGGRWLHHIIDPRTGEPAQSRIVSATLIARTATEADVYAKCALMLGPAEAVAFANTRRTEGLFVLEDRSLVATGGWPGHRRSSIGLELEGS